MQGYDATLKLLLQSPPRSVFQQLFGATEIRQWLNAEMPQVRALRADLLGQTATGSLLHIELQSANDSDMPLRMAEYSLAIYRQFRQLPQQLVLYVGESEMRMETALVGPEPGSPDLSFRFRLLDFGT